ncbi:alpha/beta fold hydrolase [Geodermatophilus sp. SYSU D00691]
MPSFPGSFGRIHHSAWLPDGDVSGVLVFLHGYGEHIGLYDVFARRLTADGFAVHAMDAAGHGRSDGERGVVPSLSGWVDDARHLVRLAQEVHAGRPLLLAGHSAGALAAYLLTLRSPGIARALVASGAPLRPQPWLWEALEADDSAEPAPTDPGQMFSTHPAYVHALLHDPLTYHGGFRRETLQAIAAAWPESLAGLEAGRPDIPVLFVHGEADPVIPITDARASAAQLPDARVAAFPGDLHDVLNESDRAQVHDTVADFVVSVLGVPAGRR